MTDDLLKACSQCGSTKVMHDLTVLDNDDNGNWNLQVQAHGSPGAWLLRDTARSELRVTICGECGWVLGWRATNPQPLWEAYCRAHGPQY